MKEQNNTHESQRVHASYHSRFVTRQAGPEINLFPAEIMDIADAFAPLFGTTSIAASAPVSSARSSGVGLALEQLRPSDLCKIVEIQPFSRFLHECTPSSLFLLLMMSSTAQRCMGESILVTEYLLSMENLLTGEP